MKTLNEILDSKHIYSQSLTFAEDGVMGYLNLDRMDMSFVASWGGGWEHVSVSPLKRKVTPTWETMCKVKDIFYREDEAVIQIHPPRTEYVNNLPHCLHLWRAIDQEMVLPPSFMVGFRDGQTMEELKSEIDDYYDKRG